MSLMLEVPANSIGRWVLRACVYAGAAGFSAECRTAPKLPIPVLNAAAHQQRLPPPGNPRLLAQACCLQSQKEVVHALHLCTLLALPSSPAAGCVVLVQLCA